jgi:hypothetical protein
MASLNFLIPNTRPLPLTNPPQPPGRRRPRPELAPGFRLLADLTQLESISIDCAPELAKVMDRCAKAGVKLIVRVIPDPSKDIGFTILTRFHYPTKPRAIVCETLVEAAQHLGL